jgi:transcription elongation factor GreA
MATVARQPEPITREGFERLRAELDRLHVVRRREAAEDLDDQAALERRIEELEASLSFVRIVDPPPGGVVDVGQRVRLRLARGATPVEYELVGPIESDPSERRISVGSPIGQALVGRRAGDVVQVETPTGQRTVEIVSVGDDGPDGVPDPW